MKNTNPRKFWNPRALLSIGLLFGLGLSCHGQEVLTLKPSKDAHVRGGSQHRDTNFGSEPRMEVKTQDKAAHATRQTFIGFDLPVELAKVERALFVFAVVSGKTSEATVHINYADSNWEENTITWRTKPAALARVITIESPSDVVTVDVTRFLKNLPADTQQLTFMLVSDPAEHETYKAIASKEHGDGSNSPMLLLRLAAAE